MDARVIFNPSAFKAALKPGARRTIEDFYFAFRAQLAQFYGGVKSGRVYRRPRPASGFYRASAPGQPPAIASGRMFRALSQTFITWFRADIKIDTPYAAILEGLEPSDRMAPRPFVRIGLKAVADRFNSVGGR